MRSSVITVTSSCSQSGMATQCSRPNPVAAVHSNSPTAAAPKATLMAMVVARKVRLVRVCAQLRKPPLNRGRTDSTMRLADMHRTIHPSFCQAGIASNIERNCSSVMPGIYATAPDRRSPRSTARSSSVLHAPHGEPFG